MKERQVNEAASQIARDGLYELLSASSRLSVKAQPEAFIFGQKQVLEMLILGIPLKKVLEALLKLVESHANGMLCSVMLLDDEGKHLFIGAAPSLPENYLKATDEKLIGHLAGICGTAAFLCEDIFSSEKILLGTFAMHYHEVREPTKFEKKLIQDATHLAAISIEHAKTYSELQKALSLLNATIESTADGILVIDQNGKVANFNRKFSLFWVIPESVMNSSKENAVMMFVAEQLKDSKGFVSKLEQLKFQPGVETYDILECKNGRVYETCSLPQRIDEVVVGRVWNFRDITEKRKTELAIEAANLAKAQFLANVSHEIRTPLGTVLGFSELLVNGDLTPAERQEWGGKIKSNGAHLLKLIDEVLELSKAEFGKLDVEIVELSLPKLIDDISSVFRLKALQKGIELKFVMEGVLPQVIKTDCTKLHQILINIIGNAIKFTDCGFVYVSVKFLDPSLLTFTVEDSGVGLNSIQASRLFQPFSQVDPSYTRRFGGTGLGLALARRLARALGGDVTLLSSKLEVGSQFQITIDAGVCDRFYIAKAISSAVGEGNTSSTLETMGPCLRGVKILLVEDSEDNRLLLSRFLSNVSAIVDIAENGVEGVKMALSNSYDIILMDIQMPEKNGYEAVREIRAGGFHLPIIALTAHAMKHDQEQTRQAGCDDHISKPVSRQTLIETVRRFVDRTAREKALNLH